MEEPAGHAPVVVSPRMAPEDRVDLLVFAAGVAALLVPASALVWLLSGLVGSVVAFLILNLVLLPVALRTVGRLRIDQAGIRFGRRAGRPAFLPWNSIRSIRPASRREVVLRGWLLPPIPPREATRSMTSVGHYRIEWEGGYTFYPPLEELAFRSAVERWASPGVVGWAARRAGRA